MIPRVLWHSWHTGADRVCQLQKFYVGHAWIITWRLLVSWWPPWPVPCERLVSGPRRYLGFDRNPMGQVAWPELNNIVGWDDQRRS